MKAHSQNFKKELVKMGRQFTHIIISNQAILQSELISITPHFKTNILKSAMKQLDIESKVDIPKGTQVNYQLGVWVDNDYEFLDYGNYIVYSSEKQEDTKSYKIVCFDKMLYAMKEYEPVEILYPATIRQYLTAICNDLGLSFANEYSSFANYNRELPVDVYEGLNYTYRDILDEIAEVTASIICINANDELEIRYPNNTLDEIDEKYIKDVKAEFGEKYRTN